MDKNEQKNKKVEEINQQAKESGDLNIPEVSVIKTQSQKEAEVLKFWEENNIFEKSINLNKVKNELEGKVDNFVFYDGPPFATGLPHYGSLLQSYMKDSVPRFKTMRGKSVRRVWGWDCHGLPIENLIEKELGLKSKKEIEEYGLDKFYKACADSVLRYEKEWKTIIPKVGRWIDMENPYKTMDATYTESVWWAFSELYKKGLAYEGYKVMHVCPRCETPLAHSEVASEYKDVTDISVYVNFELAEEVDTYMLAWTTTPWTLPGNTAIAINKDLEYVKVKVIDIESGTEKKYILTENFLQKLFIDKNINYEIVDRFKGEALIGKRYKSIFSYFNNPEELSKIKNAENIYKVWHADFVTNEMGTGIAHEAPAFGEDDMNLAIANDIPVIKHVKMNGEFIDAVTDFKGMAVKKKDDYQSADIEIIKSLAYSGKLFAKEKIIHPYPHCWRCDTPLLNYATSSWFIAVTKMRDKLISENKDINWIPASTGQGRFGKWLEGARDWAVSRNRYWGAPLPVWKSEKTGEVFVPASLVELGQRLKSVNDYTFMRHGEIDGNKEFKVCLHKDADPLNELGAQQVKLAAERLKSENKNYDLIVCSPFLRTKQTAEIVKEILSIKEEIIEDELLAEWNIGEKQNGKTWPDLIGNFYKSNRDKYFGNVVEGEGESKYEVAKRVNKLISNLEKKYEGKKILLISHRATICLFEELNNGVLHQRPFVGSHEVRKMTNAETLEIKVNPFPVDDRGEINFHMPFIDEVKVYDKEGNVMKRDLLVFDCWYESGSMSYAQFHYPFENKELFEANYPANFIGEGLDQTRGWFYTSLIMAIGLFDKKSFENVICTGMMMAEDGKKMSKKLKNYTDPELLLAEYGSDALRYYILSSSVIKGENVKFSDKGLGDVYRKNIVRLGNILSMYNLYKDDNTALANNFSQNVLDLYILARLKEVKIEVTQGFEGLELDKAFRPIEGFIDDLSVWYLRRSRERIKSDDHKTRDEVLSTLRYVLFEFSKILGPIMPFTAEMIWKDTKDEIEMIESVHLAAWGEVIELSVEESEIIINTKKVQKIISAILDERVKAGIKVRQPLASVSLNTNLEFASDRFVDFVNEIKDEVNIKEVSFKEFEDSDKSAELDVNITEDLKIEGAIRELARTVQEMRKSKKLNTQDVVKLNIEIISGDIKNLQSKLNQNIEEFKKQCNILEIIFMDNLTNSSEEMIGEMREEMEINFLEFKLKINIIF